ncbi:MAG: cytochrome c-type biogenesis protein CcmH [Acidisphaera sp.]|nr:cytochrome c-type biogenesis protein CcmH [Acidisphaera sp.]
MKALLVALALLLAAPAWAVSDPAETLPNRAQEHRAERIGSQLRCLVCQNESIEDSEADLARDLRRIVRQHVAAGHSDRQVIAWMVSRYGDFVRLRPPFEPLTFLLWFSPVLALGVAAAAVFGGRRGRNPVPPLTDAEWATLATLLQQEERPGTLPPPLDPARAARPQTP